jgi:hypothetical protein
MPSGHRPQPAYGSRYIFEITEHFLTFPPSDHRFFASAARSPDHPEIEQGAPFFRPPRQTLLALMSGTPLSSPSAPIHD